MKPWDSIHRTVAAEALAAGVLVKVWWVGGWLWEGGRGRWATSRPGQAQAIYSSSHAAIHSDQATTRQCAPQLLSRMATKAQSPVNLTAWGQHALHPPPDAQVLESNPPDMLSKKVFRFCRAFRGHGDAPHPAPGQTSFSQCCQIVLPPDVSQPEFASAVLGHVNPFQRLSHPARGTMSP